MKPLYKALASRVEAIANCTRSTNVEWLQRHTDAAHALVKEHMPSGSGIDNGTKLLLANCTSEKLVFVVSFHHMNDVGMYDGWTNHLVTVRASMLHGIDVKVGGRDRNDIKDYLGEMLHDALMQEVEE